MPLNAPPDSQLAARPIPPLGRDWIAAHLPHRGAMCLLDQVVDWDAVGIRCRAVGLDSPRHPLRASGRLPALAGIEYAAQAMALHGALRGHAGASPADGAGRAPRGYLASVRKVELHVDRLDTVAGTLTVEAQWLSGTGTQVLYDFSVRHGERLLLCGRAAVVLDADRAGATG